MRATATKSSLIFAWIASIVFHVGVVVTAFRQTPSTATKFTRTLTTRQISYSCGFSPPWRASGSSVVALSSSSFVSATASSRACALTKHNANGARRATILGFSSPCFQHNELPRSSCVSSILRRRRTGTRGTPTTRLNISFSWFGGNDNDDKNNNEEGNLQQQQQDTSASKVNTNLDGVTGIMDSMSRFKTSQRVGERTSAILLDLSNTSVEGVAAAGKVRVTFNGQQKPMAVQIDEDYLQSLLLGVKAQDDKISSSSSSSSGSTNKNNKNSKSGVSNRNSASATAAKELGDLLTEAMQDAHAKSTEKMEEKMKSLYTELGLSD